MSKLIEVAKKRWVELKKTIGKCEVCGTKANCNSCAEDHDELDKLELLLGIEVDYSYQP